jgi:X-Pro dipeptidyl-peptidase
MKNHISLTYALLLVTLFFCQSQTQPYFENGQAQIVEAFNDEKDWIRHDLWVETDF